MKPEKRTPSIEDPKTKKSQSAPVIETPEPPQVMDPSAHPYIERKRPLVAPGKGNKK